MDPEPKLRSDDLVTPAIGGRKARNTSVRATRGNNTTRRNSDDQRLNGKSSGHEPRKLNLSPAQQERETDTEPKQQLQGEEETQLLKLPPSLFPHWCVLMLFSALCLAAVAAGTPLTTSSSAAESNIETQHYENLQMVMAISTLSLMLTFLAAACYVLIPASFVGTLYEVTVIGLNIVLHSGNLPIVMNPSNDLAVQGPSIVNGNLFVLSWLCFFMCWALLKLVLEQAYCMDQARNGNLAYLTPTRDGYPPLIPITPYRMANICLVLSSLVVLVSSARSYKQQLCSEWDRQLCKRLLFSVSVGVMSVFGLLMSWCVFLYLKKYKRNGNPDNCFIFSTQVRLGLTGLLALGWFLATALGTFGKHGPGHALGNYFFGVWFSLLLSLYLFKKTLLDHLPTQSVPTQSRQLRTNTEIKPKRKTTQHQKRSSQKKNRIPGLIDDGKEEEEKQEEQPTLSTSLTEDTFESPAPSMVTPTNAANVETPTSQCSTGKSSNTRDTIAISLDESFLSSGDPEQGLRIIRKSTEKKEPEEEEEEKDLGSDDVSSDKTPKRGSATRSATNVSRTAMTSASRVSEKRDFYHERMKPTSIPFATDDFDDEHEEGEDGLSPNDITMAIDNTSGAAQRDVLIDPEEFRS